VEIYETPIAQADESLPPMVKLLSPKAKNLLPMLKALTHMAL